MLFELIDQPGVPQNVKVFCPGVRSSLHSPKSVNLKCPSQSMRMFSGLRSLKFRVRRTCSNIYQTCKQRCACASTQEQGQLQLHRILHEFHQNKEKPESE